MPGLPSGHAVQHVQDRQRGGRHHDAHQTETQQAVPLGPSLPESRECPDNRGRHLRPGDHAGAPGEGVPAERRTSPAAELFALSLPGRSTGSRQR